METDYYELRIGAGTPGEKWIKLDLDLDLSPRGTGYDSRFNFHLELYESGRRYSYRRNYTATYTPDNPNNPFAGGTFNYSGVLEYRTPSRYYRLESVASDLRYLQSCSSTFVGGTLSLTDSRGNRLILRYNGCNNVTAIYNGQPL
ncbi:hypothetical protein [Meiothermus sp. QL-1]|uniref:hypothetical protein n=1 Tax=Meiothermus sp. QL-1 TaxID=2058095 RepID=UPI001F30FD93|nr:hypothetical protein [Meiothermus sp. QL-1]